MEKLVIIGSGSGGLPVASMVAKQEKHRYDITVITKDSDIAYSPCGIPFVLKGDIPSYDNLVMRTKEYYQGLGIHIIAGITVEEIDARRQKIRFHDTWLDYDYLVIATGTSQRLPHIQGLHLKGVFSAHIKTLKDAEKFFHHISISEPPLKIAITGSGSIDLEFAVALKERGHEITVVERKGHLMPDRLDGEMGEYVREYLESKRIRVITGQGLRELKGKDVLETVVFDDAVLPADLLLFGTEFVPETALAKKAGFDADSCGIKVNGTSRVLRNGEVVQNVFASGACAHMVNKATGKKDFMFYGSTSIQRARVVADQLLGKDTEISGSANPRVAKLWSLYIGAVGITSEEARMHNIGVMSAFIEGKNTARYYPGSVPVYQKLLFEKNTLRFIGAQVISREPGVKERIDALSIAMSCGFTARDLAHIETAYSPPASTLVDSMVEAAAKVWLENRGDGD